MSDEKRKLSKAPAPIKPLSGNGRTFQLWQTIAKKPDWREWNLKSEVEVWQACALSLDIDPHSMRFSPHSWMAGTRSGRIFAPESFPSEDAKTKFEARQRALLANLSSDGCFSHFIVDDENPNMSKLRLSQFSAWASSQGKWEGLPAELLTLATSPDKQVDVIEETDTQTAPKAVSGIPKQKVIAVFNGLHFATDAQWSKTLANVPKWLEPCRVMKGSKKTSALWNPVQIAIALYEKGIPLTKLDKAFVGLKDWTNEWQEVSEYFRN